MNLTVGSIVEHPKYGEGAIFEAQGEVLKIYFKDHGEKALSVDSDLEVIAEGAGGSQSIELEDVVAAVKNVFEQFEYSAEHVPLGERWEGGTLVLQPADPDLQSKEIPMDTFFHKIVMVRDRLRVMEQQINSHAKLSDEEKVNLQQYVTRIYGSLTSFNVLFSEKQHQFRGQSSK